MKLSFQDDKKLYFLLEYCPGGELFSLLAAKDKLTEDQYVFIKVEPNSLQLKSYSPSKPSIKTKLFTESKSNIIKPQTRKHHHWSLWIHKTYRFWPLQDPQQWRVLCHFNLRNTWIPSPWNRQKTWAWNRCRLVVPWMPHSWNDHWISSIQKRKQNGAFLSYCL